MKEKEFINLNILKCPYCMHEMRGYHELEDGEGYEQESIECDKCKKRFLFDVKVETKYNSYTLDLEEYLSNINNWLNSSMTFEMRDFNSRYLSENIIKRVIARCYDRVTYKNLKEIGITIDDINWSTDSKDLSLSEYGIEKMTEFYNKELSK